MVIDVPYRELHLLMDEHAVEKYENYGNKVCTNYADTDRAVHAQTPLIFTTIPHFLSFNYATRLFIHINGGDYELIKEKQNGKI